MAKKWIQKAINPKHKGYCSPMTKSTCTPRRKALAMTFKKHHGFHSNGGEIKYDWGGALNGGMQGASSGSALGPWGMVGGAAIGAITGSIFGNKRKKEEERLRREQEESIRQATARQDASINEMNRLGDQTALSNMKLSNKTDLYMAKGGKINKKYAKGGLTTKPTTKSTPTSTTTNTEVIKSRPTSVNYDVIDRINKLGLGHKSLYQNPDSLSAIVTTLLHPESDTAPAIVTDAYKTFIHNYNKVQGKNQGFYYDPDYASFHNLKEDNPKYKTLDARYKGEAYNLSGAIEGKPLGGGSMGMKANGGRVSTPLNNTRKIDNKTRLMVNNSGTTSGTHETGYNIPMSKGGKTAGTIEPGEVITTPQEGEDIVLTKRYGPNGPNDISFADRYRNLDKEFTNASPSRREEIVKQKRILPKQNASIAAKLNLKGNRMAGGGIFTPENMSMGLGAVSAIGKGILANQSLKEQSKDIARMQELSDRRQINPIKYSAMNTNIDVSDQIGVANRGYLDSTAGLQDVDPSTRAALRTSANVNRMANLNNIYSGQQRTQTQLMNQNIDSLNRNRAMNTEMMNQESGRKLDVDLQAMGAQSGLRAQRLSNIQGTIGELQGIGKDALSLDTLKQRYKDTIGDSFLGKKAFGGKVKSKAKTKSIKSRLYAK